MRHPEDLDLKIDLDTEDSATNQAAARRTTLVSVGVNLSLTVAQVVAGILAGSQALVADAIHSLSDLISDFVVLFASHHSQKGPDATHHYGHQRFENAASLVLGLLLLAVGVGMLWNAVVKLEHPEAIQPVKLIGLWVSGRWRQRSCCSATCWPLPSVCAPACWSPTPGTHARTPPRRWWWRSALWAMCSATACLILWLP
jgi:hypothetical protein